MRQRRVTKGCCGCFGTCSLLNLDLNSNGLNLAPDNSQRHSEVTTTLLTVSSNHCPQPSMKSLFFFPSVWVTVASINSLAVFVAYIKVYPKKDKDRSYEAAGSFDLENFQGTQLFRINVYKEDGSMLTCVPLAVDQ